MTLSLLFDQNLFDFSPLCVFKCLLKPTFPPESVVPKTKQLPASIIQHVTVAQQYIHNSVQSVILVQFTSSCRNKWRTLLKVSPWYSSVEKLESVTLLAAGHLLPRLSCPSKLLLPLSSFLFPQTHYFQPKRDFHQHPKHWNHNFSAVWFLLFYDDYVVWRLMKLHVHQYLAMAWFDWLGWCDQVCGEEVFGVRGNSTVYTNIWYWLDPMVWPSMWRVGVVLGAAGTCSWSECGAGTLALLCYCLQCHGQDTHIAMLTFTAMHFWGHSHCFAIAHTAMDMY